MSKQENTESHEAPGVTTVTSDVATISLPARLPPFWRQNPRLWFAQFEAAVAASKIGEDQKFNLVVPLLGCNDLEQIADIILNPPATGKYNVLKNRLISTYQESDHRQLQKLLSGLELGDSKPSQLLRKMRELSGQLLTDEALKVIWLNQIPTQIRGVLSINTESTLETLAAMADKMIEHFENTTVAAMSTSTTPESIQQSTSNQQQLQISLLSKQIEKLSLEIAELRSHQERSMYCRPQPYHHSRSNSRARTLERERSRSRPKCKPGDANWLCFYHYRYGDAARKCELPCAKSKAQQEN